MTFGLPDPAFGSGGTAEVLLNTAGVVGTKVVGQYPLADGKILEVIAGNQLTTLAAGGVFHVPVLLRFNPDGTPDTTFGPAGQVAETAAADASDGFNVTDSALQADGKLVLVGTAGRSIVSSLPRLAVERINPDGSLDTTFQYTGPSLGFSDGAGSGIAISASGKILIATSTPGTGMDGFSGFDPAFLRLNTDGSPDPTFGPAHDGKIVQDSNAVSPITIPFSSLFAAQGEDAIAVESYLNPIRVIRLDPSGLVDTSFGNSGAATYDAFDITPHLLAIDPQGRILLAGENSFDRTTQQEQITRFAIARLDPSGHTDTTFGSGTIPGIVDISFDSRRASATTVAFLPGGQILAAGTVIAADARFDLAMARMNDNGSLDTSFGPGGTVITPTEIFATSLLTVDPQARVLEARYGTDEQDRGLIVAHRFLTTDVTSPVVTPSDVTGPSVLNFATGTTRGRFSSLTLTFSEAMAPMSAGRTSSYRIVLAGRDGKFGTRDDRIVRLRSATYNATTHAVTIRPRGHLSTRPLYQLTAFASDLSDVAGNALAGQGNGVAGRNYVTTFGAIPTAKARK